ncbi:SMI1/KNR4 family protein [Paenibacillus sp. sptzw28]|nr:SMI1/KNR4 family protein [Paenibacillus sp. sptzw28]
MKLIDQLISRISLIKDCEVLLSEGLPVTNSTHILPSDVQEFYKLCGGVNLYKGSDYSISIVRPEEFVLSSHVILGEIYEDDISSHWYVIGKGGTSEYISIDLAPERYGRCYDSFAETFGLAGDSPIIASSFTELLKRLIDNKGERYYWLDDNFIPIGDAYDDLE